MSTKPKRVLFACTRNAGRSQIANAFFNQFADPAKAHSISAGLEPAEYVQPVVVEAMREIGLDLSQVQPIELTGRMLAELDFLVTLGCSERCPTIPSHRRQDWQLRDTWDQPLDDVRATRDEIHALVVALIAEKGWGREASVAPSA